MRSLESSETPVLYRGRTVPEGSAFQTGTLRILLFMDEKASMLGVQ